MGEVGSRVTLFLTGASEEDERAARSAVEACGGTVVPPDDGSKVDIAIAFGSKSMSEFLTSSLTKPVLPVGHGRFSISPSSMVEGIEYALSDRASTTMHPIVSITTGAGDSIGRAIFDVTLVTAKPARISEFSVTCPSGLAETVRSDGVVVATPIGSSKYAAAAGGPMLEPGTGLSVVPIAPFTTQHRRWVTADSATLSVERDEESVVLVRDAERIGTVEPNDPVTVSVTDRIQVLSIPPRY